MRTDLFQNQLFPIGHMKITHAIWFSVLMMIGPALSGETLPQPQAAPGRAEWRLVVVPELDWSPEEAAQATRFLNGLHVDTIITPKNLDWIADLPRKDGKPEVMVAEQPEPAKPETPVAPESLPKYSDSSSVHAVPQAGGAPVNVVQCRFRENRRGSFASSAGEDTELAYVTNLRLRNAYSGMSGDVVFWLGRGLPARARPEWMIPNAFIPPNLPKTSIRRAVIVEPSRLASHLPARPGISPRVPLLHVITGRADQVDWDTLPISGGPAVWHGSRGNGGGYGLPLVAPGSAREVPSWIDEYVIGNPALFHWEGRASQGTGLPRLNWHSSGKWHAAFTEPLPDKDLTQEFEYDRLPHDAVRSPGLRFAYLPTMLDQRGAATEEGDDGMSVYFADLRAKTAIREWLGTVSPWPVSATWFTDRYLIVAGSGIINYGGGISVPEGSDEHDLIGHGGAKVIKLRLYDFHAGRSYSTTTDLARNDIDPAFTEKIHFPEGGDREAWKGLWDTMQAALEAAPAAAPMTPAEAVATTRQTIPASVVWQNLGQWPPAETWELARKPGDFAGSSRGTATEDSLITRRSTRDGNLSYLLSIRRFEADADRFQESSPTIAHAEILATGGGLMPRLTGVFRTGDDRRYLILSGHAPIPGREDTGQSQWLLLIDNFKHQAWRLDWLEGGE
jgi:hypothetical protein